MRLFRRAEEPRPQTVGQILEPLNFTCGLNDADRQALIAGMGTTSLDDISKLNAEALASLMQSAGICFVNQQATSQKLLDILQSTAAPAMVGSLGDFRELLRQHSGAEVRSSSQDIELRHTIVSAITTTSGRVVLTGCIVLGDVVTSSSPVYLHSNCVVLGNLRSTQGNLHLGRNNFVLGNIGTSSGNIQTTLLGLGKVRMLTGHSVTTTSGSLLYKAETLPWPLMHKRIGENARLPW